MVYQLLSTGFLVLICAVFLRWYAGARSLRPVWVVALDVAPLVLGTVLFAALTARPLFGALVVVALTGGLVGADAVKRAVLREPVVFADRAELLEVVRHPEFYLPFAGTGVVVAAASVAVAVAGLVAWALPPLWPWSPWPGLAAVPVTVAAFTLPGRPPVLRRLRVLYQGLTPSGEPAEDMARWGMLACFVIHSTLARAERSARRAGVRVLRTPAGRRRGPVVMAQLESFFDPRRLHAAIPRDLLPGYDFAPAAGGGLGTAGCAGLGGEHHPHRVRRANGAGIDGVGAGPVQPVRAVRADTGGCAGLANAGAGVSDDLPAPVRQAVLWAALGDSGAGVRTVYRAGGILGGGSGRGFRERCGAGSEGCGGAGG